MSFESDADFVGPATQLGSCVRTGTQGFTRDLSTGIAGVLYL